MIAIEKDEHFWWTTLLRGFLALIVGSAIMVIPDMAGTLLLLPIALTMAILGLAVYGILDSVLVFVTSYMAVSRPEKFALRLQGAVGIVVGILFYFVFFDRVRLHWFLILIAVQSLSTAVAESLVARHCLTRGTSRWNFTAAAVALLFSCMYFYIVLVRVQLMEPQEISWLVFVYLVAFGIAQCLTAARMIYADHVVAHPNESSASTQAGMQP